MLLIENRRSGLWSPIRDRQLITGVLKHAGFRGGWLYQLF